MSEYYETIGGEMKPLKHKKANPLIKFFGKGPDNEKCKSCVHFYRKKFSKTYFKCALRGDTAGPGTDHRANWPSCAKFQKNKEI